MDRAEAIKWFEEKIKDLAEPTYPADINSASGLCQWLDMTDRFMSAYRLAIAALREREECEIRRHLKRFDIKEPRKTNADRIRAMSDEELAEWIEAVSPYEEYCGCCPAEGFCNTSYKEMECKDIVRLWLQQPCGGADHE